MKIVFLILNLIIFSTIISSSVLARSGCCSWHGGVCGCSCCDGTALSAKCAPYYPSCNSSYNSYSTYTVPKVVPLVVCPLNSSYNSLDKDCHCNSGYAPALNNKSCIKIPENAHQAFNGKDVWSCDYGYEEKENSCIKIKQVLSPTPIPIIKPLTPKTTNLDDKPSSTATTSRGDNRGAIPGLILALVLGYWWYKKSTNLK